MKSKIRSGLLGLAVGDALGVPYEFISRGDLTDNPVDDMVGYGTFNQPAGTWSDDTSLSLCLMDSLAEKKELDYADILSHFRSWLMDGAYTCHGQTFGVGHATRKAILLSIAGHAPLECGGIEKEANGNGSLMRILPMAFYLHPLQKDDSLGNSLALVHNVSSLTHGHPISQIGCGIYVIIADALMSGRSLESAFSMASRYYNENPILSPWLSHYDRLLNLSTLEKLAPTAISSSTYIVHTLEAAVWSFVTTDNYKDCVLKAINLGLDTDTVGAVAGGLAGIAYGMDNIPCEWLSKLEQIEYLETIINKFSDFILNR